MANQYLLSERDYKRVQDMLRWYERLHPQNTLRRLPRGGTGGGSMGNTYIASVVEASTGGGYYLCNLQVLDYDYWNTSGTDSLYNTGTQAIVLNLPEIPVVGDTDSHALSAGDKMLCWQKADDQGYNYYVGIDALRYNTCAV